MGDARAVSVKFNFIDSMISVGDVSIWETGVLFDEVKFSSVGFGPCSRKVGRLTEKPG